MDWNAEFLYAMRVLYAAVLGGLIGWEREKSGSEAGVRTFMAIALGSCAFSLVSQHVGQGDPGRIAAQVVSGIGFIGAGVILVVRGRISGLTTAATLWSTAAVGMASAYGMYLLAGLTTLLMLATLLLQYLPGWNKAVTPAAGTDPKPSSK